MKTSAKRSVIPTIKVILNIAWYLTITFTVICLIIIPVRAYIEGYTSDVIGSFQSGKETEGILKSNDPNFGDATTSHELTMLTFKTENIFFFLCSTLYLLLALTASLLIIYHLRKMFSALSGNSPFNFQNYKRIRLIAFLTIFSSVISWLLEIGMSLYVSTKYNITSAGFRTVEGLAEVVSYIILGFIILAIAEIFNHGIKLKEEQDLTV